jgi:murein DD-endopeptidase MepM/ murein hydrolase activator NlpD
MLSPGNVRIASCLALALAAAGCTRAAPPAPVTWRVPPAERAPVRSAPQAPPRVVERQPEQRAIERAPERAFERPPERPAERNAAPGGIVVVAPGETLYAVARRTNVPLRSLIEANNLQPPFRLVAGTRLTIPPVQEYVAQQGDTVYSVSRRFGVDSSTLASTNNLTAPYAVQSGAPLILPAPTQPAAPAPAARPLPPVETPRAALPAPAPNARTAAEPSAPAAPPQQAPSVALQPPVETPRSAPPVPAPNARIAAPAAPAAPPPQQAPSAVASLPPNEPAPRLSVVPPIASPPALTGATPPPSAGHGFRWPVQGPILASYGAGPNGTQNDGINIAAPRGTPVVAVEEGVVKYAGNELRGFGNLVLIKHPDGWISAYAHCDSLLVKRDERVRAGQVIARVGATGDVSTPQLHFELRRGTRAVDPASELPPVSTAAAP